MKTGTVEPVGVERRELDVVVNMNPALVPGLEAGRDVLRVECHPDEPVETFIRRLLLKIDARLPREAWEIRDLVGRLWTGRDLGRELLRAPSPLYLNLTPGIGA